MKVSALVLFAATLLSMSAANAGLSCDYGSNNEFSPAPKTGAESVSFGFKDGIYATASVVNGRVFIDINASNGYPLYRATGENSAELVVQTQETGLSYFVRCAITK